MLALTRSPRWGQAVVRGRSMEPTLHDGDRLCAEMDALFIKLNPGQA